MKETPLTKKVRENIPWLMTATFKQAITFYEVVFEEAKSEALKQLIARELGRNDRFFLLIHLLKRVDAVHPWLYARCREVEQNADDHIDLWARGHYKSSIITYAGAIQEILKDPEISIGIFSHTRPIARSFLRQIKREFESNDLLKFLYPDVLYKDPQKDSPLWSEESGIVVKRKSNPKEATVESWGLVDGQPTGKHFKLRIYDDVVTRESVTTGEQILKTTEAWELSLNLSSRPPRQWIIGTRYHFADTYKTILDRGVVKARIYPATENGIPDGKPVFLTDQEWNNKKNESGPYITACQMLLNPIAGSEQDLKPDWVRTWEVRPMTLNVYIICDPADSKEKGTSNTAMAVIGMDANHNKYLLDGACHKMNLKERWEMLKELHNKWTKEPGIQGVYVGYEKYGMQSDIQHFNQMMEIENHFFDIQEVSWTRDNINTKDDRIRRLVPDLSSWRFFFPYDGEPTKRQKEAKERGQDYLLSKPIKRVNHEKKVYNLVTWMLANEYMLFPATTNKDFLDVMSRIYDMEDYVIPGTYNESDTMPAVMED